MKLVKAGNSDQQDLCELLDEINAYFYDAGDDDCGDNRNSVQHGFMHPRFWTRESFETFIHDIARLSPYAGILGCKSCG